MKQQTLMAFTPPGTNPPYFNVTQRAGVVTITVRNADGATASMDMSLHEWVLQVNKSRDKVVFSDDPVVHVNEVLRNFSVKPTEPTS